MSRREMRGRFGFMALLGAVLTLGLAGCVDEEVVFQERPIFQEPPSGAASFLGYSEQEEGVTVCGNCHQGMQSGWETTGHADAWAGLQNSGHANESCEGCHSVNELGNPSEGASGWVATGDPRYQDVQCESCHGPGLDHVDNPDAVRPLANIAVGIDLETGCAECHQGTHHPFVEQWSASAHGNVTSFAAGRDGCNSCHDGERAISVQFGESSDWAEQDNGTFEQIVCATCHDPHGSDNIANLRAPIEEASRSHLCVRCHSRQGTPDFEGPNEHGPHAFQGQLVLGEDAGWIPPNSDLTDVGRIVSTHGTEANPRLCATCHLPMFEVTDAETGEFQVQSVGHLFEPIPCPLDETGVPQESCSLSERNFEACTESGCHGTVDAARSAMVTVRNRLDDLLDQLWDDSNGNAVLETTDGGLLPQVLAQDLADGDTDGDGNDVEELDVFDNTFTTAEGAMWNAQVAWTSENPHWGDGRVDTQAEGFGSHKGSGEGVHNPFLLEALLTASIDAVRNEYGVTTAASVDLSPKLKAPPGVSLR